jgi:hypothetical protein
LNAGFSTTFLGGQFPLTTSVAATAIARRRCNPYTSYKFPVVVGVPHDEDEDEYGAVAWNKHRGQQRNTEHRRCGANQRMSSWPK